jgi:Protein of unknown function (DUF3667)
MTTNCQNCNTTLQGKYCNNCGQSAETHKIDVHYLWHDIQHGLLHFDKGILFTTKELFTRPGHSIREFLEGKRVKHFKPISLVIVLAGLYGLLFHFFKINMFTDYVVISGDVERVNHINEVIKNMSEWIGQHYSILALLQIPIFTIGTYLCFRKAGYNFVEHLIINTFLVGQRLILHIFTFPLYYISNGTPMLITADKIINLIGYALAIWALIQLFKNQRKRILKTIFSLLISFLIIFLILTGCLVYVFTSM